MKSIQMVYLRLKAMVGKAWLLLFLAVALAFSFYVTNAITTPTEVTSLRMAVVDLDNSPLSNALVDGLTHLDGLSLEKTNEDSAHLLLARGAIEGILIIDDGYQETLLAGTHRTLPIRYESAAAVDTRTAAREMIAGQVITQRSLLRAKRELTLAGVDFSEEDLEAALALFNENTAPLYQFTVHTPVGTPPVAGLEGMAAGYLGFVSLVIILMMMTLSQWFAGHDSRAVANRMLIQRHGKLLSFFGDVLLLLGVGFVLVLLAFLGSFSLTGWELIYLWVYVYCIAGLCLLLSTFQEAGSIEIMAPLIALFTSILGGSFMDLGSLSPVMRVLSLFTPQGQMLYGVSQGVLWNLWVLLGSGSLVLVLVYFGNRKIRV